MKFNTSETARYIEFRQDSVNKKVHRFKQLITERTNWFQETLCNVIPIH